MKGQTLPLVVLVLAAAVALFFAVGTDQQMRGTGHSHSPLSGQAYGDGKSISVVAYTDGSCISTADCDQPGAGSTPPASQFAPSLGPTPIACVAPTCPAPPCHDSVFMSPLSHCCTPKQRPCRNMGECSAEHASSSLGINPFACSVFFPPFAPPNFVGTLGGLFHPADSGGFGCCTFCGDGLVDLNGLDDITGNADNEECDDNNQVSGDGCSSSCKIEPAAPPATPGISIRKIATPAIGPANSTINFTINITTNTTIFNITVIDIFPGNVTFNGSQPPANTSNNTWSFANISNTSLLINITVNVTANLTNCTNITNSVSFNFTFANGTNSTNVSNLTTNTTGNYTIDCSPLIITNKTDVPDPVIVGTHLNYTINLTNVGDESAFNVTVTEGYPGGTSFVSSQPVPSSGSNVWVFPIIQVNQTVLLNITVLVGTSHANGTVLNNTYNVSYRSSRGVLRTTNGSANTTVIAVPNLTISKVAVPSAVGTNSTLNFTITVTNTGGEIAYNVTVFDTYPPGILFNNSNPPNDSTSSGSFTLGNLTAGSVTIIQIAVNTTNLTGLFQNNVTLNFSNASGQVRGVSTFATFSVGLGNPGQGGGSPGVGRWIQYEEVPEPQYPQIAEEQMEFDSMIDAPMPAWPLLDANIETNSVACGYVTKGGEVVIRGSQDIVPVPPGFEIIAEPLEFSCAGDTLDFTLNVPDNFEEVKVLRCKGGSCAEMPREIFTDELVCANKTLQVLRREEVLSRSKGLDKPRVFTSKAKQLSPIDRSIVGGSIRLTLTGELQSAVNVEIAGREGVPKPSNPTLSLLGTPHQVSVESTAAVLPAKLDWSFIVPDRYDITNFAVYAIKGDEWVYLGAQYNVAAKLVTVQVPNLKELLVDNKVTFVMVGLADPGSWVESEPHFTQSYNGNGGRDAIVLIHGFGAAATWQPFVDDFQLTNQPYQVWLFSYPASRPNEDNARSLAAFLELHSGEYDNVYLVSHSLGSLVTREALESARRQGLPVLGKVKRLILVAGPGAGTPTVQVFRELFTKFLAEKTALGVLNMHPRVYDELRQGISLDPMQGIEYDVIAGNVGYWFTETLFGDTNDGVVGLQSAQTVGSQVLSNQCTDSFELSVSHVDLNDHPAARRVAQRLITGQMAEANPDLALPGFNQFVRLQVDECSQEDRVFVLGRRVTPLASADPSGCACGNGVCGVDETRESCPKDCVQEIVRSTGCILLPIPMMLVLLALVALTGVALVRKHVSKKAIASWMWVAIIALAGASVVMQAYHASSCLPKFPAVYLGLISVLVLLAIDWFIGLVPKKSVPKKQDISSEIDDIADAIKKIKK